MEDYYEVLDVPRDATVEEIKKSYHLKVLQLHPDKRGHDDPKDFVRLNSAWKTLSDEQKRKEYDAMAEHQKTASNYPISEEVKLSDMDYSNGTFTLYCRCGGTYCLDQEPDCNVLVGYDMCSLFISVVR